MKAIVNTFSKSDFAVFNGKTYDVVEHQKGFAFLEIEGTLYPFGVTHILIIDIENEMRHAAIRNDKTFCDYWYQFLCNYVKKNTISLKIKEVSAEIAEMQESEFESELKITEIADELILFDKNKNNDRGINDAEIKAAFKRKTKQRALLRGLRKYRRCKIDGLQEKPVRIVGRKKRTD